MRWSRFLAVAAFLAAQLFPAVFAQTLPPTPPVKLALNPVTNKVYMVNTDANSVSVFDAARGTNATIAVGPGPSFIAVNPTTNRVYVNNGRDATLSVIDGASDSVIGTFAIGSWGPIAIDPVTNIVYVVRLTGTGTDEVTFFSGDSHTWYTIATESFQPGAMAVNPVTGRIYVAHYATGDVRVISGAFDGNAHPATFSIGMWSKPFAVAANPVTNKVYVVTEDARGPIGVINGADNTAVFPAVTSGHAQQPRALAVNPVTNKAYAAFAGEVIVIDGNTNALTYVPVTGTASGAVSLGIDFTTNRIYVAAASGTLSIIDGQSDTVVATESIPVGTSSVAVNPVTGTAYFFDTTLQSRSASDTARAIPLTTTITPFAGDTTSASGTITLNAASGFSPASLPVRKVYYQIDSRVGAWTAATGTGPFTASFSNLAPGSHTIHAFATDGQDAPFATGPQSNPLVGQLASYTFTVPSPKVDASISLASSANPSTAGQNVTFTASVSGSAGTPSGTATFRDGSATLCAGVALAGGSASCSSALAAGTHAITVAYSGDGSYNAGTSNAFTQTVSAPKATATIGLASSANPSTVGQMVTFTASFSGAAGTPTGTATFRDGATALSGCANLTLGGGSASCATGALAAGGHSISVQYSGDASYAAGTSSALAQTVVQPAPASADLAVSQSATPNPAVSGDDIAFTITVANQGPAGASGVTLTHSLSAAATFVSATAGCSPSSGTVTCTLGSLAAGAASSVTVVVRPAATGTITGTASVSATEADPAPGNNSHSLAVSVGSAPTGSISNLSTRAAVLAGNDVLIGGFVIGGSGSKTVVVRARGPSLAAFGVGNALANPTLQLVRSSDQQTVAVNDDWQQAGNAAQVSASGFAPSNAQESAILVTLPPGAYTAIVAGADGGTGVGIVEVFELDQPEAPLVNISTRGRVLTGNEVMIGGFVIGGSAQSVVVRARGPSLAAFGIADPLANPVLEIVRSSDQTVVATNDDWRDAGNAAQLSATGLAPSDDAEAAVLVTLEPGAYTAIVRGAGGATGVGIVEVFRP